MTVALPHPECQTRLQTLPGTGGEPWGSVPAAEPGRGSEEPVPPQFNGARLGFALPGALVPVWELS